MMLSYGLKPYEQADHEEARAIADAFREYDEAYASSSRSGGYSGKKW